MKIGNNDYTPPFWWGSTDEGWFIADSFGKKEEDDGEGDEVAMDDILSALNELASLRQERDSLEKRVEELEDVAAEWCMKCDTLANWFDAEQKKRPEWKSTAVQDDLRKFRDILGRLVASKSKESPDEV